MRDRLLLAACGLALVVVLPLSAAGVGGTFGYGDIQIKIISEPLGEAKIGYAVYSFRIDNTSKQKTHQVRISMPVNDFGGSDNAIRAISRSVEIGPNASAPLSLFQPPGPGVEGTGARVFIDGKPQAQPLEFSIHNITGRGYGHAYYGGRKSMPSSPPGGTGTFPLVLVSPGVKQELLDAFNTHRFRVKIQNPPRFQEQGFGGQMGGSGMQEPPRKEWPDEAGKPVVHESIIALTVNPQRPLSSMRDWPKHWLGYSRYEGVILTRTNLLEIPESDRLALWQYAETGGVLLVLGEGPVASGWKTEPEKDTPGFKLYRPGFGVCVVAPEQHATWKDEVYIAAAESWKQTSTPLQTMRSIHDAHRRFPVVADIGIPVRGLFVLMFLFALVIGPLNISLLSRWKRRLWLLWTVPVLSGLTVLAVFGYMFLSEGWSRHVRTETITVLDENTHRATTAGWTAFYSPVTPSDGLRFSNDTEVTQQGETLDMDPYGYGYPRRGSGRTCFIELTSEQHFERGWVTARVPSHFQVRKNEEARRERVSVRKDKAGGYTIVNSLGADIKKFWFADEEGRLHIAAEVGAGAESKLSLTQTRLEPAKTADSLRNLYEGDWLAACGSLRSTPGKYLRPLTYLADVEGSPFLEEALKKAKDRKLSGLVIGLVKELDHEN